MHLGVAETDTIWLDAGRGAVDDGMGTLQNPSPRQLECIAILTGRG